MSDLVVVEETGATVVVEEFGSTVVIQESGSTVVVQEVSPADIVEVVAVGPQGTPGTVSVGTVRTGAAGTDAIVTDRGTPIAAILDFTIPRGDVGDVTPEALAAKVAAQQAATNASASQSAAASSETAAATSASNAANSAAASAGSAATASTKATDAASSATSAANSANTATASASTASTKASEASTSANSAASSASTAAAQASAASASALDSSGSAATASGKASDAASSAAAASSSANSASGSAISAGNSATTATGQATAARNSATAASTSASAAGTSASLAQDWATKTSGEVVSGQGYGAKKYANDAAASATTAGTSASNASTSANSSSTSALSAAASATSASGSATTATSKASEASSSAANAAASALSAGNSASAAASSANDSASSASTASTQAGIATSKASDASTSAANAATSATNAASSASSAAGSATTATSKAADASTSAAGSASSATTASTQASNSAASATSAANSATAAAGSATTASTQASNAATSATNAANSATSASGSATTATTQASNASTSASLAQDWATKTSAEVVTGQGYGAKKYAIDSAASATSASGSASSASTSAGNAATSATTATTQATNAANSATAAANSATSAAGSATTATTQAGNAATSATNAANSATSASNSATSASTSATNASGSAATVSGLLASFRQVFLGAFTSDSAAVSFASSNSITLVNGTMYENTTSTPHKFRIYDGSSWADYDASAQASQSAAGVSAANAAASASAAAGSATSAATSATNAASSATSASGSATNAATSATNAASSATSASGSAATATTQASNASTSATSAAASAAAAANSATSAAAGGVRYDYAQSLTSGQQAQARSNIGLAAVASSGAYSDLTGKPTALSAFTNDVGFLTGITSGQVTSALGFTPYNATNPSGYVNQAGARSAVSASGSLSYNAATGVISYTAPTAVSAFTNDSGYITASALTPYLTIASAATTYQAALVSGTSIKTVNGVSLLGSGNLSIVSGVSSFNTRTGDITLSSGDVTAALGFTPYNSTNPAGYVTQAGARSAISASGSLSYNSTTGVLSYTAPTALSAFTNDSGFITSSALSPYLTTATAASTYQTQAGMSSYQTVAGMSSYLTTSGVSSTYLPLAGGTLTGSLTFNGSGLKITGDLSGAANVRLAFQTSTANGQTLVTAIPNGTAVNSQFQAYNSSDPLNSSIAALVASASQVRIVSGYIGTGTLNPITFIFSNTEAARFTPSTLNMLIGTSTDNGTDKLQVNGTVSATGFTGNASTASKWASSRTEALTGDVTGSASVDGSANWSITTTLANSGVTAGTYSSVTVDAKGRVTAGSNPGYITGITGSMVTTALGFTPYNATNPSGYITASASITGYAYGINSLDRDRTLASTLPTTFGQAVRFDFANASATGTGGNYAGVMTFAPYTGTASSTGDASYQLAFGSTATNGGGTPQLRIRKGIDSTWNSWYDLLTSANYSSYALPLSGGTLTGNLAGTNASFSGQGRFSGWYTSGMSGGFAVEVGVSADGYIIAYNRSTSAYGNLEIDATNIRLVPQGGSLTGPGGNTILHAGNYSSYALPLSGGTVSGQVLIGYDGNYTSGPRVIIGAAGNGGPATTGTSQTYGALRLRGGDNAVLDFGLNSVNTWIQATDRSALNSTYTLQLNPNGGAVTINGSTALHAGNYSSYALPLSGGTIPGGNYIRFGPNPTWSSTLQVGGDGVNGISRSDSIASVVTTNGNLHLDAGSTRAIYLNYYSGTGGIQFGNGASGLVGSLSTAGLLSLPKANFTPNTTGVSSGLTVINGDITAYRSGGTTGVIYLSSSGSNYLYWDGSNYNFGGNVAIHSANYTNYSPSLAGSGANGTWGINVTGSAGSVAWGNVSSKPTSVMYYQGFTLDANTMDSNSTGFTYSVNAPYTGPVVRFSAGGGYDLWLNAPYSGGSGLRFRTRNGDYGTLNPWYDILHSGNYTSYAPGSGSTWTFQELYHNGWVRSNSTGGHYWQNYSRGISVADQSFSYGNIGTYGTGLNGWTGYGIYPNNCIVMANGSQYGFYNPSGGIWLMLSDMSGNTTFAGNVTAYSDLRLKNNVREIDNVIERRNTLAKAAIKYERDGRTRIGYGAQTLRDNGNGEFVLEADDALKMATGLGTLSVDYGETAAVLAVASKMTDDRVALLEAKIAKLEALVAQLIGE